MPGLWKAWKAKNRLLPLPTSPLEIPPKGRRDSHISTAPTIFFSQDKKHGWRAGFALRPKAGASRRLRVKR